LDKHLREKYFFQKRFYSQNCQTVSRKVWFKSFLALTSFHFESARLTEETPFHPPTKKWQNLWQNHLFTLEGSLAVKPFQLELSVADGWALNPKP
jgi:hypothetical protein